MASCVRVILLMVAILKIVHGQSCGGNRIGSGRITSPNYPNNYPNSANCQWNLTPDGATGNVISIFVEDMVLEAFFDAVEIYSDGILMTRYQEDTAAHKAVYSGSVTVVFRSDSTVSMKGFSIFFNSTGPECGTSCSSVGCNFWTPNFPSPYPKGSHCEWNFSNDGGVIAFQSTRVSATPFIGELRVASIASNGSEEISTYSGPAPIPMAMILESFATLNFASDRCRIGPGFLMSLTRKAVRCGERLVGQGTFHTPNYPDGYPDNAICVWQLTALTGSQIQLTLNASYVEYAFDFVRVYSDNQVVASYTGNVGPFTIALGSEVTITFQSDETGSAVGLSASFISVIR